MHGSGRFFLRRCILLDRIKIKIVADDYDIFDVVYMEEKMDENTYFEQYSAQICELTDKAYEYAKRYSSDKAYLSEFCVALALELDNALANNTMIVIEENNDSINRILDKVVALFDDAEYYLQEAKMEIVKKQKLYRKMRDFFGSYDFTAMYRSDHYGDAQRAYRYQTMIDDLKERKKDVFYTMDINLIHVAEEAENKKTQMNIMDIFI